MYYKIYLIYILCEFYNETYIKTFILPELVDCISVYLFLFSSSFHRYLGWAWQNIKTTYE